MLAFRSGQRGNRGVWEEFLYELKAGPAGGRLRRPSSRRQRHAGTEEPASTSRTIRSRLAVALTAALAQRLGELRSGGSCPVALTLVERA
jgi:hypothetical protein